MCPVYAIESSTYMPAMREIIIISQEPVVSITTSFNHGYISDTVVRIYVPDEFGMSQINLQEGAITVTGLNTFTMPIDTSRYDPFIIPLDAKQVSQVVPIGSNGYAYNAAIQNVL